MERFLAEEGGVVGSDAVGAPCGEFAGAVEIVDRPGDDGEPASVEVFHEGLSQQRVIAGDAARLLIAFDDGEEEVKLGSNVDRVEQIDFGTKVADRAEQTPVLGRRGHASVWTGLIDRTADEPGSSIAAILEVEEDARASGGFLKEFSEAEWFSRDPPEVPLFE